MTWKNWRGFKLRIDEKRLIENQGTINDLMAKIQEQQNEVNCMNETRIFLQMLNESVQNRLCHNHSALFPLNPKHLNPRHLNPRHLNPKTPQHLNTSTPEPYMILGDCQAAMIGHQIFGIRRVFRERNYVSPPASSSSPYPGRFNPWFSNVTKNTLTASNEWTTKSTHNFGSDKSVRTVSQTFIRSKERIFSKDSGADQRLQISDFHFDKFTTPPTFACWRTRFKTKACLCSHFLKKTTLWIEKMEMVESVDDAKSSRSVLGLLIETLDWNASAMNKIIQSSRFKKKSVWNEWMLTKKTVSFDEDISRTWSTSTSGVIGANDSVENYANLFTVVLRTDDIHEFNSWKWDEFFCRWHKNPSMKSRKACTNLEYESLRNSIKTVFKWPGDSSEEIKTWWSQIEN